MLDVLCRMKINDSVGKHPEKNSQLKGSQKNKIFPQEDR